MKKKGITIIYTVLLVIAIFSLVMYFWSKHRSKESIKSEVRESPGLVELVTTVDEFLEREVGQVKETPAFWEDFEGDLIVEEASDKKSSQSDLWWLSSGGYFSSQNGVGQTVMGDLSESDKWRQAYARSNPVDTDEGLHPQNIFRLVLKNRKWEDYSQRIYFRIKDDNLSESENRNSSNGLLFFNRYEDAFNLYYTGIRVDGHVTIKKKIGGVYYTLVYEPLSHLSDKGIYDKWENPNLLPKNEWIGLRSDIKTKENGAVEIKVFVDWGRSGEWEKVAEAMDTGKHHGGFPFLEPGHVGVRTDFMDVEFDDYVIFDR